jgi:hypothetical protein
MKPTPASHFSGQRLTCADLRAISATVAVLAALIIPLVSHVKFWADQTRFLKSIPPQVLVWAMYTDSYPPDESGWSHYRPDVLRIPGTQFHAPSKNLDKCFHFP